MAGAVEGEVVRGSHANVALAHGAPRRGLLDLPARLDDAVRLLPLEEGEGRVVVLGNRAGGRRRGEWVLRRHGGTGGRDEADTVRAMRRAASRAIEAAVITRGRVWREQGGPARLPCAQALCKGGKAGRSVLP